MANSEKFTNLLDAYLAGRATDGDYNELMRLIKDGSYDDLLKQKIDDTLHNRGSSDDIDGEKARQLLFNILNSEKQTAELITVRRRINNPWIWAAAAAVIAAMFTIFQLFVVKNKNSGKAIIVKKENKAVQPAPGAKAQKYIRLQDGSTVLLNEGSKLDYPDTFGNTTREVTLIGEGYFDIRHETNRPFIVHTGKVETTVLGTAFNIKAYPQQKEIRVTVTRGKVKVSNNKEMIGVITPNESITVNTENKLYVQQKVNADTVVEWKKQYLVLDNISMGDAAVLIDGRYHVNISFSNENLKACRISAMFLDNENLEQVLTVVTGVVNASYTAQPNDQIIISGEGCN